MEQCLCSIQKAIKDLSAEVIVVDNNSSDGSIGYLQPVFPWVKFIINSENIGFAKANNQGLALAKGAFILFLNPDTLLPEDCLMDCIEFMKLRPAAGGLGIKMLDGSGIFLPESKRAFPSPLTSLFKLTGLSNIFPKSRLFSRYHLGHLSKNENHKVDVLAGAFMLIRKKVLDEIGSFDEKFFMYGEDIDLSYRIQKAGWGNYYFADNAIIHFKGESTKKGGLNYVRIFYQAMSLFVKKHYGSNKAAIFLLFIQIAIWLRAALSAMARCIQWIGLPIIDATIIFTCLLITTGIRNAYLGVNYKSLLPNAEIGFILFPLLFLIIGSITGLYDKGYLPKKVWTTMAIAIIINLALYSLTEEPYRFGRMVALSGGMLAMLGIILLRWILVQSKIIDYKSENKEYQKTAIVATSASFMETKKMMQSAGREKRILGRITPDQNTENAVGQLHELDFLLGNIVVKEIIFCIDDVFTMRDAMHIMQKKRAVRYKFHYIHTQSIVGSDSKETAGEALLSDPVFNIARIPNRRYKRMVDLGWCVLFLLSFPIHLLLIKNPKNFFVHVFTVLTGKKTWISYCHAAIHTQKLPVIKPGILLPTGTPINKLPNADTKIQEAIEYWYAKDYTWQKDVRLVIKGYYQLGY